MKALSGCLIGLVFVVSVSAEPLLEGRVRLESILWSGPIYQGPD